jgi:FRG domain
MTPEQKLELLQRTYAEFRSRSLGEWVTLVEFQNSREIFEYLRNQFTDSWLFRGHSDCEWDLSSSFDRICNGQEVWAKEVIEDTIRSAFKRQAHQHLAHLPEADDDLEWLSLMQHYGAPTRLLDVTRSPYVGLFFAVAEQPETASSALWAFDEQTLDTAARRSLLDFGVVSIWDDKARYDEFFRKYGSSLVEDSPENPLGLIPISPKRANERMAVQQGLFLLPLNNAHSCEINLFGASTRYDFDDFGKRAQKLDICPSARDEVLYELTRMNISYATLFPDFAGFARSLGTVAELADVSGLLDRAFR